MIRVTDVTKRYGEHLAVDRVSFAVSAGEVVGFLGPNGAGKSTILRMLATSLAPTSGVAAVAGFDVAREPLEARSRCGYLAEHNPLFESMRVAEWLDFVADVHGLAGARRKERREYVVDRCALGEVLGRPIRACSKGFRQRIGLAAAILHDPPVLLLDEPTHGLDPLQVVAFRDLVRELRPGRAILEPRSGRGRRSRATGCSRSSAGGSCSTARSRICARAAARDPSRRRSSPR